MNLSRLRENLLFGLFLVFWLHGTSEVGSSQNTGPGKQTRRLPRPQKTPVLQLQNLPPELEKILADWEIASAKIKKLQGEHYRYVYDYVFMVEKRSQGLFYYEAPDKGRIDLVGRKVRSGTVAVKLDPNTGKQVKLKVEADRPEKWICDGQQISMVNVIDKTVERFPIPPENKGASIIDGPLPFLFGMPAEKAKRRYFLKLLKSPSQSQIWLEARPRWRQDAVNYRQAKVILDKKTFLPVAVQLIDPPGTKETVFTFLNLEPNKRRRIFGGNPFNPWLRGYRIVQKINMPSLVGFHWKKAEELMTKAGCKIKWQRGNAAIRKELVFVVYDQQPSAGTPLTKDQQVMLTLYDKQAVRTSQNSR